MSNAYTPEMPVTYELLTHVAEFTHCCEASDLGLRAGQWPELIAVDRKFGNGMSLVRHAPEVRDGELLLVEYRQLGGVLRVRIFND